MILLKTIFKKHFKECHSFLMVNLIKLLKLLYATLHFYWGRKISAAKDCVWQML
jgi:hypothetical protein